MLLSPNFKVLWEQATRTASVVLLAVAFTTAPMESSFARSAPESFADLAEELSPSVVNISTAQNLDGQSTGPNNPLEDLFKDLYPNGRPNGQRRVQSLGSGFVISPDGMVVTNNHVIEDADEITVNFPDGLSLTAKVIGTDPQTDIALLKIEHDKPLPFVSFGDSDVSDRKSVV